ncbi:MAG: sugar phosphate isomerase/epimerase [Verrucomicrobia bacterium]|nr:sugar phosphate isomerase/epimerase [Verrucomicrobiota bacterium]
MNNKIGVLASLHADRSCFAQMKQHGLNVCQLCSWDPNLWTDMLAKKVRREAEVGGIHMTSLWSGYSGPSAWNFTEGPATLGFVPPAYRYQRMQELMQAGLFAKALGVKAVITHLGFIPENACDPAFQDIVVAVRHIADHLKNLGLEFWFETGQETPVTLLRLIQAVGLPNLGINLDPANLILYGKGNPIDALDVFGPFVRNIHAKDGLYPTDPMQLGKEVKVGKGRVRFPEFVRRLGEIGFTGEFIIEREISGDQQNRDIAATVAYLKKLLAEV